MIASTIIDQIRSTAATAAAKHDEVARLEHARLDAEGTILSAALEAASPALPALVGQIRSAYRLTGHARDDEREEFEIDERRAAYLLGDSGPTEDTPRATRGRYEGTGLYVLEDGRIAVRTWTGSWSRWQGESSTWESALREVTPEEACADWDLEAVVGAILSRVTASAASDDADRDVAEVAEVARLQQIATLLQSP
jgi:hypothetical protein